MGAIGQHEPVMLVVAALSAFDEGLDWSCGQLRTLYGPLARQSPRMPFTETQYYEPAMGPGLQRQFFAFEQLIPPEQIVAVKRRTNELEAAYAALGRHPVPRPINLDPGYLSLSKWVLASTKDHAHRLYLDDGIYAELTLQYQGGRFVPLSWTYPDYRRDDYHAFLIEARADYQARLRGGR